jgi:glutamine cyclotransferase
LFFILLCACLRAYAAPELEYQIVKESPHDPGLFTQGLILDGQDFIESSGLYGRSFVRRYKQTSSEVLKEIALPKAHFAEGLAIVDQHLYLLTWQEELLYIFDKNSLKPLFKKRFKGEGWGLTFDGSHLIMSNGSSQLFYRDKGSFEIKRSIDVKNDNKSVTNLNELEYAWQSIWANVWLDSRIFQIHPLSGKVIGEINLETLVNKNGGAKRGVLNGIAYDREADALWITGKNWPKKYLIKVNVNSLN